MYLSLLHDPYMDPPSSPLSKKNDSQLKKPTSLSKHFCGLFTRNSRTLSRIHAHTHPSHPHTSTADQPSIGDTGEHNGECQGKGESDQSRKRKDRGEDDPVEAGAAPGAHTDTHDLGIANPPTPAPTEAMQFVSRVHFNGNPSVFEDTEVVLARDHLLYYKIKWVY